MLLKNASAHLKGRTLSVLTTALQKLLYNCSSPQAQKPAFFQNEFLSFLVNQPNSIKEGTALPLRVVRVAEKETCVHMIRNTGILVIVSFSQDCCRDGAQPAVSLVCIVMASLSPTSSFSKLCNISKRYQVMEIGRVKCVNSHSTISDYEMMFKVMLFSADVSFSSWLSSSPLAVSFVIGL